MEEMKRYIGAAYSERYLPAIITKTLENFTDTDMTKITPRTGVQHPNIDAEMT